jgi:two-component system, NarL family, nitrate/nitrite response regulator NarL
MVQAGAQGVIRKTAPLHSLLDCLKSVAAGNTWMDDVMFQNAEKSTGSSRSNLTMREQQVAELVEQGLKNKEIARSLGICPGTVKIHLKHIFEKTGVRGRYGLALSGLKERGYRRPRVATDSFGKGSLLFSGPSARAILNAE